MGIIIFVHNLSVTPLIPTQVHANIKKLLKGIKTDKFRKIFTQMSEGIRGLAIK